MIGQAVFINELGLAVLLVVLDGNHPIAGVVVVVAGEGRCAGGSLSLRQTAKRIQGAVHQGGLGQIDADAAFLKTAFGVVEVADGTQTGAEQGLQAALFVQVGDRIGWEIEDFGFSHIEQRERRVLADGQGLGIAPGVVGVPDGLLKERGLPGKPALIIQPETLRYCF